MKQKKSTVKFLQKAEKARKGVKSSKVVDSNVKRKQKQLLRLSENDKLGDAENMSLDERPIDMSAAEVEVESSRKPASVSKYTCSLFTSSIGH